MKKLTLAISILLIGFFSNTNSYVLAQTISVLPTIGTDERFGTGGNCAYAKDLNIPWAYGWGGGAYYANQYEYLCINPYGRDTFFMLGKLDNLYDYHSIVNLSGTPKPTQAMPYLIPALEAQYLKDNQDRALYATVNSVLVKYNEKVRDTAKSSFLLIEKYTKDYPGAVYSLANEPDILPRILPEDYAKYFHAFYTKLKKHDPLARLMVGGVTAQLPSVDPWSDQWVKDFAKAYNNSYGAFPNDIIWGVHVYEPIDPVKAENRLIYFKDHTLADIGQKDKPIWLTEFGSNAREGDLVPNMPPTPPPRGERTHGFMTPEQQEESYRRVNEELLTPLISWLKTSNYVQKWFIFVTGNSNNPTDPHSLAWSTDILRVSGTNPTPEYNPIGIQYSLLMDSGNLVNKGFESSAFRPWGYEFWNGGVAVNSDSIDSSEKKSGLRSLKIQLGSLGKTTASIRQTRPTTSYDGKNIKFSVQCKTSIGGKAYLKINITNTSNVRNVWWTPSVTSPVNCNNWTKIETPIVTIPDDTKIVEFEALAIGQDTAVWFDDFKVEVQPTSSPTPTPTHIPTPTPTPTPIPGDISGPNGKPDGKVDIQDYNQLVTDFGKTGTPGWIAADINKDGKVDIFDYNVLVGNFGK